MTPNEVKDYELLKKIQSMCDEAQGWECSVSFENIWQDCSNEIGFLKSNIGDRVIQERLTKLADQKKSEIS